MVVPILFGVFAYVLLFAYDWLNVCRPQYKYASVLFVMGVALVVVSTVLLLANSAALLSLSLTCVVGLAITLVSLALTIWALVFSLPKGTYVQPGERRPVYEGGAYSLCRHPGVFFYCCFYVGLFIALPCPANAFGFAVLCAGNIAYMILQDVWTFPNVLEGYEDYKKRSNMFLPRF